MAVNTGNCEGCSALDEVRGEVERIKGMLAERDRRMARHDKVLRSINIEEFTKKIEEMEITIMGENGHNGLKRSVDRLIVLIDGDSRYGVIGLKNEVTELIRQRNQIKWALIGMLAVTSLGNASSILALIKAVFGM